MGNKVILLIMRRFILFLFITISLQADTIYACIDNFTKEHNFNFAIKDKKILLMTKDRNTHTLHFKKRVNVKEFSNDPRLGDIADIYENDSNQLLLFPNFQFNTSSNVEIIGVNWIDTHTGAIAPHMCQVNK